MKKKQIKLALKNNGVKGWSRALILSTGWVVVGQLAGKLDNGLLYLKPINKEDKTSRHFVIQF